MGFCLCRYDCSSADLNPIGAISKNDLRKFLVWAAENLGYSELMRVQAAPPTAELEPVRENVAAQVILSQLGTLQSSTTIAQLALPVCLVVWLGCKNLLLLLM